MLWTARAKCHTRCVVRLIQFPPHHLHILGFDQLETVAALQTFSNQRDFVILFGLYHIKGIYFLDLCEYWYSELNIPSVITYPWICTFTNAIDILRKYIPPMKTYTRAFVIGHDKHSQQNTHLSLDSRTNNSSRANTIEYNQFTL